MKLLKYLLVLLTIITVLPVNTLSVSASTVNDSQVSVNADYELMGNSVYVAGKGVYMKATPHTLTSSGWVEVDYSITGYSGAVDVVTGFTGTDGVTMKQVQVSEPYEHTVLQHSVTKTKSGNITNVYPLVPYKAVYEDWNTAIPKSSEVTLAYAGANKWQTANTAKVIASGATNKVRIWVDIPFRGKAKVSGKYTIGIKPSNLTVQQAKEQGKLWILDPWYDATWGYRKAITVANASADYQTKLTVYFGNGVDGTNTVYCDSKCNADFSDLRFTGANGSTLIDYWVESYTASTSAIVWVQNNATPDTTLYMYYGNAGASTASNGANTFIVFDDFERGNDGDAVGGSWTEVAGSMDIDTGLKYGGTRSALLAVDSQDTIPVSNGEDIAIQWRYYKPETSLASFMHGDGSTVVACRVEEDEDFGVYDGASYVDKGNCVKDSWGFIELYQFEWDAPEHVDINLDGATINDADTTYSSASYNDLFRIATAYSTFSIDNFIVRKWASTEPSFTFGTESTSIPTNVVASDGTSSTNVTVTWTKATDAIGYYIYRDAVVAGTVGDIAYYYDTGASAGVITAGNANATDNTSSVHVTVSVAGESIANGTTYTYKVVAKYASTNSTDSNTDTGYRAGATLTYKWYRSNAGSDANYSLLAGATTDPYNDATIGQGTGTARYYKAQISATGSTSVNTTADIGERSAFIDPTVVTTKCTGFTGTTAVLEGRITAIGDGTRIYNIGVQYGLTTGYTSGNVTKTVNLVSSQIPYTFTISVSGLSKGTVYHYRAFATTNSTGYGSDAYFSTEGSPVIYEYYNTGGDSDSTNMTTIDYVAQIFTAVGSHSVTSVRLPLKRIGGDFGNVYVYVMHATADNGTPTGLYLAYGTLGYASISTADYSWYNFTLNTELPLESGEYYSIVAFTSYGDSTNYCVWQADAGGGYAGGIGLHSTNGGVTWTSDAPTDYLFELWGNPSLKVSNGAVIKDYTATSSGDWMIFAEVDNTYATYYEANADPAQYFQLQLLDGATIKAVSVVRYWQRQPMGIYISSTLASSLAWGTAYTLRVTESTGTYYADYVLASADWKGTNKILLDSWIRLVATDLEDYYSKTYLVASTGGDILNSDGGVIFSKNIPSLPTIRPSMFQVSTYNPATGLTNSTPTGALQADHVWSDMIGADNTATLTQVAGVMGLDSGKDVGAMFFWFLFLIVGGLIFGSGHMTAGLIFGCIPLCAGMVLGFIDVVFIIIPLALLAVLFGMQKFIDRTG